MDKSISSFIILVLVMLCTPLTANDNSIRPPDLPKGYDLVGIYRLESKTKVQHGKAINQITGHSNYKAFSNGKTIRLYTAGVDDAFHEYEIYSSQGISSSTQSGATRISPGIQARNIQPSMIKQISVTPKNLTITQIPPLSDSVTILYAKRQTFKYTPQQ